MEPFVHAILILLVGAMIAGILYYIVGRAPWIGAEAKGFIQWVILALCGIAVIYLILLPLMSGASSIRLPH